MSRISGDRAAELVADARHVTTRHESVPGPRVIEAASDVTFGGQQRAGTLELRDEHDYVRMAVTGILIDVMVPRAFLESFLAATHREPEAVACPVCGAKLVDAGTTSKGQVYEHDERIPRSRCPFRDAAYSLEEMRAGAPEEEAAEFGPDYDDRIKLARGYLRDLDLGDLDTSDLERTLDGALDVLEAHDREITRLRGELESLEGQVRDLRDNKADAA
jgi:hypothetical protein